MKFQNNKEFYYIVFTLLIAVLAYTLFYVFALAWHQPMGSDNFFAAYLLGFLLHMPLWTGALVITGLLVKQAISLKLVFILECILFAFLLTPFVLKAHKGLFDYVILPFYAVDLLLCLALLIKLKLRFIKNKGS